MHPVKKALSGLLNTKKFRLILLNLLINDIIRAMMENNQKKIRNK